MSETALAWTVVIGSIALTYLWRAMGVLFANRIDPQGAAFGWVSCVSYAMLAGLISRMLLVPIGVLESTATGWRLAAVVVAFVCYFGLGRRLLLSVSAGVMAFIAMMTWG